MQKNSRYRRFYSYICVFSSCDKPDHKEQKFQMLCRTACGLVKVIHQVFLDFGSKNQTEFNRLNFHSIIPRYPNLTRQRRVSYSRRRSHSCGHSVRSPKAGLCPSRSDSGVSRFFPASHFDILAEGKNYVEITF